MIYTNCEVVELFLNNVSLGSKPYTGEQLVWLVPYSPGKIEARGMNNGKTVITQSYESAGKAQAIATSCNKQNVTAGSNEVIRVEIDVVDENNTPCPYASDELFFGINGPLQLLGVDNGDPTDMFPYKHSRCRCFRGKCVLLLQPTEKRGKANVTIKSEHLKTRTLTFEVI